jgi:hypothetical protein
VAFEWRGESDGLLFVGIAQKDWQMKPTSLLLAVFLLGIFSGRAEEKGSAQILVIRGRAKVSHDKGEHWSAARVGQRLRANDALLTAKYSTVDIGFQNIGAVRLASKTRLGLDRFGFEDEIQDLQLDLRAGRIVVLSDRLSRTSKFEIKTTAGVVGVREEPAGFDTDSMGLVRCMWGLLIEVFVVNGVMIPPVTLGPDSKTVMPKFGDEPNAGPAKLEAREKQELAAELESLRQSMLHPAAVLLEAEKGRGIRRTKGNP